MGARQRNPGKAENVATPGAAPSGPGAPAPGLVGRFTGGVRWLVGGCVSLIVGAVTLVGALLLIVVLGARDLVVNYVPGLVKGTPWGFLFTPPKAIAPMKHTDEYTCELDWARNAANLDLIDYNVACTANVPLVIESFVVSDFSPTEAGMTGNGLSDRGTPIDSQKPIPAPKPLQKGEKWEHKGQLRAEDPTHVMAVDHFRTVVADVKFSYPDDTETPDTSLRYKLELYSSEGDY